MAKSRSICVASLLLALLLSLQGCGFHLRGDFELPSYISPVYVAGARSDMRTDLTRLFRQSGIEVAGEQSAASSILRIRKFTSDRRVLALDSNGKVAEFGLIEQMRFDMVNAAGEEILPEQTVTVRQSYINTEERVLGKQLEEDSLRSSMRRDLATQTLRRLQTQLK